PVVVYDASATQASVGSSVMPPAASDTSAQAAAGAVSRGELLEATLATPVAVTSSGGATPALAEIGQGPLEGAGLVGQATRSPEGIRVIEFNMLIAKDVKDTPFATCFWWQEERKDSHGFPTPLSFHPWCARIGDHCGTTGVCAGQHRAGAGALPAVSARARGVDAGPRAAHHRRRMDPCRIP